MAERDFIGRLLQILRIKSPVDSVSGDDIIAIETKMQYSELFDITEDGDLIYKAYIDNSGAVANSTTSELTATQLDAAYPSAALGFEVICEDITDGPMIYKKGDSGWYSIPLGTIAP